jgi:hypothetical protein
MDQSSEGTDDEMTKRTSRIAEICRRAVTPNAEGYISNDIDASRLAAVENVKQKIISRRAVNSVVDEWLNAKEQEKRWSLRK